ncbi:MAG TPA: NAD(P)-dependent oxidoreductase [Bacilli bacterium]|nr:NAD(P)-dependent oxidoreductase [Bacilli bacterium]
MSKPTIGWVGLGNMGIPMATNLIQAGYDVTVYNRTAEKATPLVELGAKTTATAKELAQSVDIVITMVSDSATVEAVMFEENGVYAGVREGQTVIDMSTIAPDTSRLVANKMRDKGVQFLDAPVSGSVGPAKTGTLVILVGGDKQVYETCSPIFNVLGKASFHFGENGQGSHAKLCVNLMLGVTIQGLSEALVLAEKTGLDRKTILDMFAQTAIASPIVTGKSPLILEDNFEAAFALKHMEKDFGLAMDEAKKSQAALPATAASHQTYVAAKANGMGDLDLTAVLVQLLQMSGVHKN